MLDLFFPSYPYLTHWQIFIRHPEYTHLSTPCCQPSAFGHYVSPKWLQWLSTSCYNSAPTPNFSRGKKQYLRKVKSDYDILFFQNFPIAFHLRIKSKVLTTISKTWRTLLPASLWPHLWQGPFLAHVSSAILVLRFVLTFSFAWNAFPRYLMVCSWELHSSLGLNMLSEHPALFSFTIHTKPGRFILCLLFHSSHWNINSMESRFYLFPLLVT